MRPKGEFGMSKLSVFGLSLSMMKLAEKHGGRAYATGLYFSPKAGCQLCNIRCSAALPIEPSWMKLRGKLIHEQKKMTFPPFEMMAAAALKEGNIWAGYRKNRSAWFPEDLKEKHGPGKKADAVYFAGCTASYVEADIGMASVRLLDAAGVDFTYVATAKTAAARPCSSPGRGRSRAHSAS